LLSRILGADVRFDDSGFDIGFRQSWTEAVEDVGTRGCRPYPIPAGASGHPPGGHGFARWAFEVEDQDEELGAFFDSVVVCSVTGSTQAGMIAGFPHSHRAESVIGIDASKIGEKTLDQVARIARRTSEAIEFGREVCNDEIVLLERWQGSAPPEGFDASPGWKRSLRTPYMKANPLPR